MPTATLSTKGQIVIPAEVRERLGWAAGATLEVETRGAAVVLRPIRPFPPTRIDDLLGCLSYTGPRKTLEEMEAGVARGAREAMKLDP